MKGLKGIVLFVSLAVETSFSYDLSSSGAETVNNFHALN